MQKTSNIIYQGNYIKFTANSLTMITKQQIRINYLKQISIKIDAKPIKYYQIPKNLLEPYGQLSGHDHNATKYT